MNVQDILKKRYNDLNPGEKVALLYHLVDKQVENMDKYVAETITSIEKDYMSAYRDQMAAVIRELKSFKSSLNA